MKKSVAFILVIMILMGSLCLISFGDSDSTTPVPTATDVPQGLVLDSSIVFAILIIAAGIGVACGYWFAKRR